MGSALKRKKAIPQINPQQVSVCIPCQQQQQPTVVRQYPMQSQTYPTGFLYTQHGVDQRVMTPWRNKNEIFYENDVFLSQLTGWSINDIDRLRREFVAYANQFGIIDRDGFRKLFIASLLNTNWRNIELNSEMAFRNFDINQTGTLDFNEYIIACFKFSM